MIRLDLPGDVCVWQVELDQAEASLTLLSSEEKARAARFRFDHDRHRYIACRGTLRCLLGEALHLAPAAVPFTYGPQGKPESQVPFSVSHSGPLALIALGGTLPLGVDIEALRTNLDPLLVGRTACSQAELATLAALPEQERLEAFFAVWTHKEAVIKAEGGGLSSPLLLRTVWPTPEPWIAERYALQALSVAAGYAAALAVTKKID